MLLATLEIVGFRITAAVKMFYFWVEFLGLVFWLGCDSLALHLLICQESNIFGAIASPLSESGTGTGHFLPVRNDFAKVFGYISRL